MLVVSTLGCAVPLGAAAGVVHSVFARACNIELDGALVAIGTASMPAGPANVIVEGPVPDFRDLFAAGERVEWLCDGARTGRVRLDFRHARRWRPPSPRRTLPRARIAANLRMPWRAPTPTHLRLALARACRERSALRAAGLARRLVGLGDGLTPSGDDFLTGLMAGLDAGLLPERRLRERIRAAVAQSLPRTNAISAHYLRLALCGQYNADLLCARDALVSPRLRPRRAMTALLACGASSGAAACAGLRAGIAAQCR